MAKFMYVGDPNDKFSGPDVVTQHGYTFYKGQTVDVDEKDEKNADAIQRLRGSSHFVDMSDKNQTSDAQNRMKATEKAEADKAKAAEEQRKRDEADAKKMADNQRKEAERRGYEASDASTSPRPPGTVTRETNTDPFNGRTVSERTPAEDHTKAGKLKG